MKIITLSKQFFNDTKVYINPDYVVSICSIHSEGINYTEISMVGGFIVKVKEDEQQVIKLIGE